jgi:RHS repeat-associated protein
VFNADRYGNLWLSNITGNNFPTQSLMPTGLASFSATTNHLVGTSYDAAGNQTVLGGNTLAYDAEGRQISAQISGSPPVTVTYAYDGLGERVTKSVEGGITTSYVHDVFGNLAEEYTTGGTAAAPPCTTCYLSWDHLGSTRMMTDQNGNVVARHDYLPFGVEIPAGFAGRTGAWGTADNVSAKFTGQERDTETGLDFFQARYHGSAQGRFLSPDPVGNFAASVADPQSWNMYVYARNNPLTLIDPTGLCSTDSNYNFYDDDPDGTTFQYDGPCQTFQFDDAVDQYNSGQVVTYDSTDDSGDPGDDGTGGASPSQPGGSIQNRIACAAEFGQNHSIAAAFGAQNTFVGNLLGGNSFSGIADLGLMAFGNKTPNARTAATALLSGGGQGLLPNGSPGAQGAAGMLSDAVVGGAARVGYRLPQEVYNLARGSWAVALTSPGSAAEEAALTAFDVVTPLAETAASGFVSSANLVKLAFDAGTFTYGAIFACH